MTVPVARQPNIEPGLKDQTNIALTLFNTILETANTRVEIERSWAVIEQDISILNIGKLGKDILEISHSFFFLKVLIFFSY
jgi:hypothetical protein